MFTRRPCAGKDYEFVDGVAWLHESFHAIVDDRMEGKAVLHEAVRVRKQGSKVEVRGTV